MSQEPSSEMNMKNMMAASSALISLVPQLRTKGFTTREIGVALLRCADLVYFTADRDPNVRHEIMMKDLNMLLFGDINNTDGGGCLQKDYAHPISLDRTNKE